MGVAQTEKLVGGICPRSPPLFLLLQDSQFIVLYIIVACSYYIEVCSHLKDVSTAIQDQQVISLKVSPRRLAAELFSVA